MAEATKSPSTGSSSGGSKASAAQDKTDSALKDERSGGKATAEQKKHGGTEPLPYPEQETLDKVTYRDPRPLDWPLKADRSVFIGAVHTLDPDGDDGELKGHVYAGKVREDEELEIGGTAVETAQIVAGGGQLNLILDGDTYVLGALGGAISADLLRGLEMNANS